MKNKYIFFDNCENANLLAKSISLYDNNRACTYFLLDEAEMLSVQSLSAGAKTTFVQKSKDDASGFSTKTIHDIFDVGQSYIFFISDNSDRNASLAKSLMEKLKKEGVSENNVSIFASIDFDGAEEIFDQKNRELLSHFEVKIINEPYLCASTLASSYKPAEHLDIDNSKALVMEDFDMFVFGFDKSGQECLRDIYAISRFHNSKFNAELFDKNMPQLAPKFKKDYAGMIGDGVFNFIQLDEDFELIFNIASERLSNTNLIVLNTSSDTLNAKLAEALQDRIFKLELSKPTIACRISDSRFFEEFSDVEKFPSIKIFGSMDEIWSYPAILDDRFRKSGKLINDYYNSTKQDSAKMRSWLALSDFDKASNEAVARFNSSYVRLVGAKVFSQLKSSAEWVDFLKSNLEIYENLARTEHLRWCAFLYSQGWDVMPISGIMQSNKDIKNKRHVCLVPFDELDASSSHFNENYKRYDFDNIDRAYEIFFFLRGKKLF